MPSLSSYLLVLIFPSHDTIPALELYW